MRTDAVNDELKNAKNRIFAGVALSKDFITETQLKEALTEWPSCPDVELAEVCVRLGFLSETERVKFDALLQGMIAQSGRDAASFLHSKASESAKVATTFARDGIVRDFLSGKPIDPFQVSTEVRYVLQSIKGRGGLGEVWIGRDQTMDRNVAVKRIRPRVNSPEARWRFVQEARVTGQLQHPNIVPVYELGASDADPFYTMRLIEGRTLSAVIAESHQSATAGRMDRVAMTRLLEIVLKAAQAIAYAHENGVLHRDLKPENIMVGRFGEVVVVDWGLAKLTRGAMQIDLSLDSSQSVKDDSGVLQDSQTRAGAILGSPLYMAPEQAAGRLASVDETTDVYGLGGILYECITGRPPHERVEQRTLHEHLAAIVERDVAPARQFAARIPRSLDAIVAKALSRSPGQRYPSATAFIDDIQRFLAGEPVRALRESWVSKLARWSSRHRFTVMSISAALFACIVMATIVMTLDAQGRRYEAEYQISTMRSRLHHAAEQTQEAMQYVSSGLQFLKDVLPRMLGDVRFRTREEIPPKVREEIAVMLLAFLRSDPEYLEFAIIPPANLEEESIRAVANPAARADVREGRRDQHQHSLELLNAVLRKPSETHFGELAGFFAGGKRYVAMTAATGIQQGDETIAVVVARVILSDSFFSSVVSLARSSASSAYVFDDNGRSLIHVIEDRELEYAKGEALEELFPTLAEAMQRNEFSDEETQIGVDYDGGFVLAEAVRFDAARPKRHFTLVFGKSKVDLYGPLVSIYQHVGIAALAGMLASFAGLLGLAWLLLRGANRWN